MKTIAAICMLLDHIGMAFYPEELAWRVIGRLAMPIFAYCIARGILHTSSIKRYMKRLAVFALVSQFPFWFLRWAADGGRLITLNLNIGFTFLTAAGTIILFEWVRKESMKNQKNGLLFLGAAGCLCLGAASELLGMDYGSYGVMVTAGCYVAQKTGRNISMVIYTLLTLLAYGGMPAMCLLQEAGVLGLLISHYLGGISEKRIGRFFYVFYPVHMLILGGLKLLL